MTPSLSDRLADLPARQRRQLGRRLARARGLPEADRPAALGAVADAVAAVERAMVARAESVPPLRYPPELPVTARREDLLAALRSSQVVIVAGETGSGKTTQLPKLCLEAGRGRRGLIGHTQPRRIAARAVAERLAEELDTEVGGLVGYQVRFSGRTGPGALVKVMTDGILLAEIAGDPQLEAYDTLILDEAHERSLNIDFLLGYLVQLLPRRPDLTLVITSATIDTARFSRHFGGAPVVEVSGRGWPVEVRYRPYADDPEVDQTTAVTEATRDLLRETDGDVLVFLSGEREIRDTADALAQLGLPQTEVLPLYARLSAAEQHRVFAPHPGRRVVLATNVAETSLTVPGIRAVVDAGTARISRYSHRTKVQRLPIEPVSQASAGQRAGRCGRLGPGICLRLYSAEDFAGRPQFTDPEILRTSLAAVLLRMAALGLGEPETFPFLDPPDARSIRDGRLLLVELGAFDAQRRLTPLGRTLARLPVDPRLARMVVEGGRNGCTAEVIVLAAALSVQDPRERPAEAQAQAAAMHARFRDPDSDFTAILALWRYLTERQQELSSSAFRRLCRTEYLHYLRIREWQDLHASLRQVARELDLDVRETLDADPDRVHQSLLAGLLSQVGLRDDRRRDYLGARGARFVLAPGAGPGATPPTWVMAGELVETHRLYARSVAKISPAWVEAVGGHLLARTYSAPRWDRRRGSAVATERGTLYGIPVITGRTVAYGATDPVVARELFLQHALVEGDWSPTHAFWRHNTEVLADVAAQEDRLRRRGLAVDDETLRAFYDARIPAEVISVRHFDRWWSLTRRTDPGLLDLDVAALLAGLQITPEDHPDVLEHGQLRLALRYRFAPGEVEDGLTVEVPLPALPHLPADEVPWLPPGLRHDQVSALLRALPKPLRRQLPPAPDVARALLTDVGPSDGGLLEVLSDQLRRRYRVLVPREAWQPDRLPDHLRLTVRVTDGARTLAQSKDLAVLHRELAGRLPAAMAREAEAWERAEVTDFPVADLPAHWERTVDGHRVGGFPSLVDTGDGVALRVLGSAAAQRAAMPAGTRRLVLARLPGASRALAAGLPVATKLALAGAGTPLEELLGVCLDVAVDALVGDAGGPAWTAADFARLVAAVREGLPQRGPAVVEAVRAAAQAAGVARERLDGLGVTAGAQARGDAAEQLALLTGPAAVRAAGWPRVTDLARYLTALAHRLEALPRDPALDRERMRTAREVEAEVAEHLAAATPGTPRAQRLAELRWLTQELRVSLFAQSLGTSRRVSPQRIWRALEEA